jgi:hypothetical protein
MLVALFGAYHIHERDIARIDADMARNIGIVIEHELPLMRPGDFDDLPAQLVSSARLPVPDPLPVRGIPFKNPHNEISWVACVPGPEKSVWYVFSGRIVGFTQHFKIEIPPQTQWRQAFLDRCLGEAV